MVNGDFVGCLWWSQLVEEVEERESKYKFKNFFFLGVYGWFGGGFVGCWL